MEIIHERTSLTAIREKEEKDEVFFEDMVKCVADLEREKRWFAMPVSMQLANVGSEVNRAIRYKNKKDTDKQIRFCDKAVELLQLSKKDPKNVHRQGELDFCIEELQDFLKGDNYYQTTDDKLTRYYDSFI